MNTNTQILEAHNLRKAFKKQLIFENLSFTLRTGEWLGIVGQNGSGKSTLSSILVGLDQEYRGEIYLAGKNKEEQPLKTWVQEIQLISQYTRNALDPSKTIRSLLKEPLQQFQLGSKAEWETRITEVLDACNLEKSLLEKRPQQLSGGQYQRVSIAQALLVQPKVLICDEITANLDKITEIRIMKLLKMNKELSVLFISHDRTLIESSCTQYLHMEDFTPSK